MQGCRDAGMQGWRYLNIAGNKCGYEVIVNDKYACDMIIFFNGQISSCVCKDLKLM